MRMNLLDMRASTGVLDYYLSRYFYEVTGILIDNKAIDHALNSFSYERLHFQYGDAMSLSFPDNSFDVVIFSQVL